MIYFIRSVESVGPMKIGYSKNPRKRLMEIQAFSPLKLRIIAELDAPRYIERQLHKIFHAFRSHGEWFHVSSELEALVAHVIKTGELPDPEEAKTDDAYFPEVIVTSPLGIFRTDYRRARGHDCRCDRHQGAHFYRA